MYSFRTSKDPGQNEADLKPPSLHGNNSEFDAKEINFIMSLFIKFHSSCGNWTIDEYLLLFLVMRQVWPSGHKHHNSSS